MNDYPLESRALLSAMLAGLEALVVVLEEDGRIVIFNEACEQVSGYGADEVCGRSIFDVLVAPDDVASVRGALAEAGPGDAVRHTSAWVTRGGVRRLIRWSIRRTPGADGRGGLLVGTGVDITEHQRAQRALETDEARLRAIAETCPDAIITIGIDGIVSSFSPAAEAMFGYTGVEVIGRNVKMLMPQPYQDQHDSYLARYHGTGERRIIGIGRLVSGRRKDGGTFPLELAVGEAHGGDGTVFVGFLRDVTTRQHTIRRVHELQTELEHASRLTAAEGLSSAIAHELTQPLTASVTYLQACRQLIARADGGPMPARVPELLEKAAAQNQRAGEIVRRMRELVIRGDGDRRPEDINHVVEEAVSLVLVGAEETGVRLRSSVADGLEPVFIDRIQIQQVVINLTRNAIEAMADSERRELAISTRRAAPDSIAVTIRDTGPGLDAAVRERLFQPFASTKASGLGLGLAISRSIIENHGGRLVATPVEGGTVFSFTLPVWNETADSIDVP